MSRIHVVHKPELNVARRRDKNPSPILYENLRVPEKLAQFAEGKKYFIRTYGCQANVRDEETMNGILECAGFVRANSSDEASLVIINTCAVRENAEDKVFGEIGNYKTRKQKDKNFILALCGCMIQETHIVDTIIEKYPQVDLMFGTHNIHQLLDLLDEVLTIKKRLIDVESKMGEVVENLPTRRNNSYKAFVNIMYGCDKFCTYCIVPYTRGKQRSRAKEDILKECEDLIKAGYQEITLLGQNVNAYGKDLENEIGFGDLLIEVAKLGIPRLRFTTSHPWDFSSQMIQAIAQYPNIMPAIHLPVQSGNDEILRKMGRRYTSKDYKNLVDKMKKEIPNLSLTTDIIVGFPNETEEQFLDTLEMVKYVQYDGAFTFIYSPRVGTPASKIEDHTTDEEKHDRFNRLVKVVEEEVKKHADSMVGKTYSVLVDGTSKKNDNMLSGYTENNHLVHFQGDASLVGKIIQVKIIESHLYSFLGEIVS